jgi:two-component system chemotaxis sensor kinase CheA
MANMDDAIIDFTNECQEMLEQVSVDLAGLEGCESEAPIIDRLYRDIHTIKGSSQLFGFNQIGRLTHVIEASLDPIRNGACQMTQQLIDAIYRSIDVMTQLNQNIRKHHEEYDASAVLDELIPRLVEITILPFGGTPIILRDAPLPADAQELAPSPNDSSKTSEIGTEEPLPGPQIETPPVTDPIASTGQQTTDQSESKAGSQRNSAWHLPATSADSVTETTRPAAGSAPSREQPSLVKPPTSTSPGSAAADSAGSAGSAPTATSSTPVKEAPRANSSAPQENHETIRVQVDLLDSLMNLAGELVLARNQMLRYTNNHKDTELNRISQKINHVTTELQNEVMKTRMQPIGNVFTKFHRVVRDLAKELNKKIDLQLEGNETELDKTLIEAVKDPLIHIIRNAADHGLEPPEDRLAAGKPEAGHIHVRAYHEGGQVIININDDGRGIHTDKISQKALERGIVNSTELESMSPKDIMQLIFAPGFSTAAQVSNISGRGVGMDVVKTNIEKIGGSIEIDSTAGSGSSFSLKIPLTLAIVPALLVQADEHIFAIPQVKLVELLQVDPADKKNSTRIEDLQGRPILRLRGKLVPLVQLSSLLKTGSNIFDQNCRNSGLWSIVILDTGACLFGLVTDEIHDSADIVVKPLASFLKEQEIFAGATILGDGRVALTLDMQGIAKRSQIRDKDQTSTTLNPLPKTIEHDAIDYLVFSLDDHVRYTIPLASVQRLEEIKARQLQFSANRCLIPYRGGLLQICDLKDYFNPEAPALTSRYQPDEALSIVVIAKGKTAIGFLVGTIHDVLTTSATISDQDQAQPGYIGHMIHEDRIYVVVDTHHITDHLVFSKNGAKPQSEPTAHHILVVDDSKFFRKQINSLLVGAGFKTTVAENGKLAYDQLNQQPNGYDLVLTDIEMPEMDGFDLVKQIRQQNSLVKMPVIALTTRYRPQDIEQGQQAGFDQYLEKLNEDEILTTIRQYLA